jgi:hypothetical protein
MLPTAVRGYQGLFLRVENAMKLSDVPQDRGMIDQERIKEVCYAVDEDGSFVLAKSAGWEPKNIANDQAWDLINEQINETLEKIKSGKLSPLAYHMVRNQMGLGLLAKYAGFNLLRVWLHLKPAGFKRLKPAQLKRYAEIFGIDIADLAKIPKSNV